MNKWFIIQQEKVVGPFTDSEIKAQVADGHFSPDLLIWGRSQNEWRTLSWWLKELPQIQLNMNKPKSEQLWHYAVNGDSRGPYNRIELVNELKNLRQREGVLLWTKGMKSWSDLYEFHDILEEVGMNRREHPRASITGSIVLRHNDRTEIGTLKIISPGGFGAENLNPNLSIGLSVAVEIKSDKLGEPISAKATVQYKSGENYYGFKFSSINMESKSVIMDYVRKQKQYLSAA